MYITRRTSYFLTVMLFVAFFGVGGLFFAMNQESQDISANQLTPITTNSTSTEPSNGEEVEATATEAPSVNTSTNESEGFALQNFHRSQMKDGKLLWEVVGTNAMYHPTEKSVDIEECLFSMRSDDDRLITLQAKHATLFIDGADVRSAKFKTDVTLHYGKEIKIVTPEASYDREAGVVTSNDHVKVVGSWYMVEGDGLHATLDTEEYKILRNVQSVIEPEERST